MVPIGPELQQILFDQDDPRELATHAQKAEQSVGSSFRELSQVAQPVLRNVAQDLWNVEAHTDFRICPLTSFVFGLHRNSSEHPHVAPIEPPNCPL